MNFARLNHILIPDTREGRDRFRNTRVGRVFEPLGRLYRALTVEGQFLCFFWLLCGAGGMEVGGTQIYLLWCLINGTLIAALLRRRKMDMGAVRVTVVAPERLTAGDVGSFTLRVRSERDDEVRGLRVIRPLLPWDGQWVGDRPGLPRLPAGGLGAMTVRARFIHRGEHHLDPFYVARVAPLGLTMGPPLETDGARFLVVPRPAIIASLDLPMTPRYQPGGVTMRGAHGESREYVGVRPYRSGDPIRDLHARSWARTGYPVVREYRQEHVTRVGVALDTDGTAPEPVFEAAISLASGVLNFVSCGEALIDLLVLGDAVHRLSVGHVGSGSTGATAHVDHAHELLACLEPGSTFNAQSMTGALEPHLPHLSCVVLILTAWDEPRRRAAEAIRQTGAALSVLVVGESAPELGGAAFVPLSAVLSDEALRL